ncbi:MAG TPA: hypothetical protein PKY82_04685 [Pyrinomonadaceae bacterium]|nr:hypothetical protein [Pyrinomonadaceae bacterium]
MKNIILIAIFTLILTVSAFSQVAVSPSSVTAYSQGATSVYLTFSNVVNLTPVESVWCGSIISAAPSIGFKCDPTTIFGSLPARYNQAKLITNRYTDIMSITPTVTRRAYADAVKGNNSQFYYVRHFISTVGGLDEYVPVTIRLSGNGAGVPFSLTAVKLQWQDGVKVVPFIKPDEALPKITAEIKYTGTGRLVGRWEIVKPGEALPERRDLLSEAALPPEERGTQKRYTLLNRFNVNLPPGGKYTIPGPENWRIDKSIEGMYILLFRVEVSESSNSASNTSEGLISNGAVAGFPMPTLRYYVGNSSNVDVNQLTNVAIEGETDEIAPIILTWKPVAETKIYRLEIEDETGKKVFSAIVLPTSRTYQLPSFIQALTTSKQLKWSVSAIGEGGKELEKTKLVDIEK